MPPKVFSPIPGRPRDMQRRLDVGLKKFYLQHPERKRRIEKLLEEAKREESAANSSTSPG